MLSNASNPLTRSPRNNWSDEFRFKPVWGLRDGILSWLGTVGRARPHCDAASRKRMGKMHNVTVATRKDYTGCESNAESALAPLGAECL